MTTNKYTQEQINEISNGCSGGLSTFYRVFLGRNISCRACCDEHDLWYHEGGPEELRLKADTILRECAANAGKKVPGWLENMRIKHPRFAKLFVFVPPLRKKWRRFRANVMFWAVQNFGKSHWG
ncbi:hypothetical protein LJB93_03590 [Desulfovibrio sp. OttesenSCG-928-F07]|nr:hypothetical protein [Desulfovibrio sp. OttesenSCG-928-F07]